jgi:hypothetical protein
MKRPGRPDVIHGACGTDPNADPGPRPGGKDQGVSRPVGRVLGKHLSDQGGRRAMPPDQRLRSRRFSSVLGRSRDDVPGMCPIRLKVGSRQSLRLHHVGSLNEVSYVAQHGQHLEGLIRSRIGPTRMRYEISDAHGRQWRLRQGGLAGGNGGTGTPVLLCAAGSACARHRENS